MIQIKAHGLEYTDIIKIKKTSGTPYVRSMRIDFDFGHKWFICKNKNSKTDIMQLFRKNVKDDSSITVALISRKWLK